jgi:hypothetical protein
MVNMVGPQALKNNNQNDMHLYKKKSSLLKLAEFDF